MGRLILLFLLAGCSTVLKHEETVERREATKDGVSCYMEVRQTLHCEAPDDTLYLRSRKRAPEAF